MKNDAFYVQPLPQVPLHPCAPWFKATPVGKNTLANMMKRMCEKAGISGGYTNHSLRAYGATTLFHAQVPEKLIQQRTGHRSLEALRQYERTSPSQLLDVSNIMSHGGNKTYNDDRLLMAKQHVSKQVSKSQLTSPVPSSTRENVPFILNNCSFSGCSVILSGQAMNQSAEKSTEVQQICEGVSNLYLGYNLTNHCQL